MRHRAQIEAHFGHVGAALVEQIRAHYRETQGRAVDAWFVQCRIEAVARPDELIEGMGTN